MTTIPFWLKVGFTLWVLLWAPLYFWQYGPQNYFWLCNLANFLILAGLWLNSRLLLSAQFLAVTIIGVVWTLDVGFAFLSGMDPFTGTDYMFDAERALWLRLLSLFHVFLPLVCLFAILRLGYDTRALRLQTAITWVLIPATYYLTEPERHINWAHPPFEQLQGLPPSIYLVLLMLTIPLLTYVPLHGLVLYLKNRKA